MRHFDYFHFDARCDALCRLRWLFWCWCAMPAYADDMRRHSTASMPEAGDDERAPRRVRAAPSPPAMMILIFSADAAAIRSILPLDYRFHAEDAVDIKPAAQNARAMKRWYHAWRFCLSARARWWCAWLWFSRDMPLFQIRSHARCHFIFDDATMLMLIRAMRDARQQCCPDADDAMRWCRKMRDDAQHTESAPALLRRRDICAQDAHIIDAALSSFHMIFSWRWRAYLSAANAAVMMIFYYARLPLLCAIIIYLFAALAADAIMRKTRFIAAIDAATPAWYYFYRWYAALFHEMPFHFFWYCPDASIILCHADILIAIIIAIASTLPPLCWFTHFRLLILLLLFFDAMRYAPFCTAYAAIIILILRHAYYFADYDSWHYAIIDARHYFYFLLPPFMPDYAKTICHYAALPFYFWCFPLAHMRLLYWWDADYYIGAYAIAMRDAIICPAHWALYRLFALCHIFWYYLCFRLIFSFSFVFAITLFRLRHYILLLLYALPIIFLWCAWLLLMLLLFIFSRAFWRICHYWLRYDMPLFLFSLILFHFHFLDMRLITPILLSLHSYYSPCAMNIDTRHFCPCHYAIDAILLLFSMMHYYYAIDDAQIIWCDDIDSNAIFYCSYYAAYFIAPLAIISLPLLIHMPKTMESFAILLYAMLFMLIYGSCHAFFFRFQF